MTPETSDTEHSMNLLGPVDLLSKEEMADPSVSAAKLLRGDRACYYDKFDPPFYILSRYDDVNNALLDAST